MVTENIVLKNRERFTEHFEISRSKLESAAEKACNKLEANIRKYGEGFPGTNSENYKYTFGENNHWVCGMYTGCLWLAYEITGDKFFKTIAENHLATYKRRLDEKIVIAFQPLCVAEKLSRRVEITYLKLKALAICSKMPL